MAPQTFDDDDESGGLDDREMPDESDMDERNSVDTEPCPYCGLPVYEKAEQCPYCKRYISQEDSRRPGKAKWFVAGVVICLLIVVLFWVL